MRIVFLLLDRSGYSAGPIVNARRLLPELRMRGHDVSALVFVEGKEAPTADQLARQGINVVKTRRPKFTEQGIEWLLRKLRDLRPEVYVPNSFVPGWFSARWAREAGIPTIAVLRNDDPFHWGMVQQFVMGERQWAVSGVVCVSQLLHDKLASRKPPCSSLAVIPSGVPVPTEAASQESSGSIRVVYVGRLIQKQKRIRELTESLVRVLKPTQRLSATLIGQSYDDEGSHVRQVIADACLEDRFTWLGPLEPEALHEELLNHHIIVLLSEFEGTPAAIMDGMACGLVPICLDVEGGVRELVDHERTGLLVTDRGRSFEEAILRLVRDQDLRNRLAAGARRHIENRYSLKTTADKWEVFCESLMTSAAKQIQIPRRLILPPANPVLGSGDLRMPKALKVVQYAKTIWKTEA